MSDDVTSMDIICGTNAVAYNHPGNKRFRFLISFNLDRYRRAKGRKQKSKVINSVVDQLIYAGCRFIKKYKMSDDCKDNGSLMNGKDSDNERWEIMSSKEGRVKVAHALRDKRQSNDHEAAMTRLEMRTQVHDDSSDMFKDSHIIAANAMILTVELTGNESETLIKALLCDAIDSVGVPTEAEYCLEQEVCRSMDYSSDLMLSTKSAPTEAAHFNLQHKSIPSTKATERLPMALSHSVPLPQFAVKSSDSNHISEESSHQWMPNLSLSSSALALEHLLMKQRYQM